MSPRQFRRENQGRVASDGPPSARRAPAIAAGAGAAIGAAVLFAPAADAQQTFVVDTLADESDGDCLDNDCTLREAVDAANSNAGELDTITFASGLSGTITIDDAQYDEFEIQEGVTIQGPGAGVLSVSGGDAERVFYVNVDTLGNSYEPVTISGLTIRDGNVNGNGAGVDARNTTLTLSDMALISNESQFGGGAVFTNNGRLAITGSRLVDNYSGNSGGALYTSNTEGTSADEVEVLISNSTLSGNAAAGGGALYLGSPDGDVVFENSTFADNTTVTSHGGGVYIGEVENGDMTVRGSTVSGNEGEFGAGLLIGNVEGSTLISNTTVSGNVATDIGGGVYLYDLAPDQTNAIRNSTIVGNTAGDGIGGGIYLDSVDTTIEISSSIIAGNTAATGPDLAHDVAAGGFDVGFSLIGTTAGDATITTAGPNLLGADPQLGPLQSNGGPTATHAPAFTSPVIDLGLGNGLTTDQRGAQRTFDAANVANAPGGDGTDIGAVELLPGGGLTVAECKNKAANILFAPGSPITGTEGDDVIVGTTGADTIASGRGKDLICAGDSGDAVKSGGGKDRVFGENGKDRLAGQGGGDRLTGGRGNDRLKGAGGRDRLSGQEGRDTLKAGSGRDSLAGGPGRDKLRGGPGKDKLKGGPGRDSERQ